MAAAIAGCVALAACIATALLRPMDAERRRLRPIANAHRLTALPAYVRAMRMRSVATVLTVAVLVVMFACAVVVAARPSGLPTAASRFDGADPEDVMVCVGGPADDPAARTTLRYFADHVPGFGTQRIGLTSPNRRVVPLTRDYQYASAAFATYAESAGGGDLGPFAPGVSYVDYAESVDDVLALCLTGFPGFDRRTAERRSVIYVGPGELRTPGDPRAALFGPDRVRELARTAGVQVNTVLTTGDPAALAALARDTGGRSFAAGVDLGADLAEIRAHPPAVAFDAADAERRAPAESPDVPLAIALLAAVVLAALPVVWRR